MNLKKSQTFYSATKNGIPVAVQYDLFVTERELQLGTQYIVPLDRILRSGRTEKVELNVKILPNSKQGTIYTYAGMGNYITGDQYQDVSINLALDRDASRSSYNPYAEDRSYSDRNSNRYDSYPRDNRYPSSPYDDRYSTPIPSSYSVSSPYSQDYGRDTRPRNDLDIRINYDRAGDSLIEIFGTVDEYERLYAPVVLRDSTKIILKRSDIPRPGVWSYFSRYFSPPYGSDLSGSIHVIFNIENRRY